MFDIFGIVDFNQRKNMPSTRGLFSRDNYYQDKKFFLSSHVSPASQVYAVEKNDNNKNVYITDTEQIFLIGFCFANKNYESEFSQTSKKFSAKDIFLLYSTHRTNMVKYIKGTFTIIIINIPNETVLLISDKKNLLPLFYYFKNNILIFSSSMHLLIKSNLFPVQINKSALLKIALFNYILGNETIIIDVFMQSDASIIHIKRDSIKEEHYWHIREIFTQPKDLLNPSEALMQTEKLFKDIVNLYVEDQKYFALTFTGGYDSRMILSVLERDKKDYFGYSYGKNGCYDTKIPSAISKDLDYDYRIFELEEEFEQNFEDLALKAILYSDGACSLLGANYVYASERICTSVDVILSGLFGSEIIKQPTSTGYYITAGAKDLLFSNTPSLTFNKLIENAQIKAYLPDKLIDTYKDSLFQELSQQYLSNHPDKYDYYIFFFREGIRKYFMQEIKIERIYVENRYPFFDDDFVELVFKTPFAGLYNYTKERNIWTASKSHLLYAYIINKNNPKLANHITTHGYKPKDILSPITKMKAFFYYIIYRNIMNYKSLYDYKKWGDLLYANQINNVKCNGLIFTPFLKDKFLKKAHHQNFEDYARYFSLMLWLHIYQLL